MIHWDTMEGVQPEGQYCIIEQYRMLMRCSQTKDIAEWNKWREGNPNVDVVLQGVALIEVHLRNASLWDAHLEGGYLSGHLEDADLSYAHLEDTILEDSHLEDAFLDGTHLERASLSFTHLEDAYLGQADLKSADLSWAHLEGVTLGWTHLEGTNCRFAIVNHETVIDTEFVDQDTDFTGVGLESVRILPGLRQLLEYNIRRKQWKAWYKDHPVLKWIAKPFWWVSDYGRSSLRILAVFFALSFLFTLVYVASGLSHPSRCFVADLFAVDRQDNPVPGLDHFTPLLFLRGLYFSVVTMTTLGFGDMHANPASIWGHVLLMFQVLLGYFILGALITRLSILFTAGGPSARFAKTPNTPPSSATGGQEHGPSGT
jgi:uncharacterized protein YjbI with pentapeptide repeats